MSLAVVEPEVEPFDPQIYFPQELAGIVHFIGELRQDRPSRALIMPNGSVEIAFFLEQDRTTEFYLGDDSPSDRIQRNEFSLVFSVANRPQIVAGTTHTRNFGDDDAGGCHVDFWHSCIRVGEPHCGAHAPGY